jgi:hypothetical protein
MVVPLHAAGPMPSVGQVTLSIGRSEIVHEGKGEATAKGGAVFPGDVVRTSASGHVHIRFVDGAHISVRPDSVLHVVDYHYEAANPSASLVKFFLEAGAVREISGLAAESARDRFRLNTPLVAIGVKGTDFLTQVTPHSTVVFVNQGAITLSPLDHACQASSVGPCSTAKTRELSASMSMNGMALIYHRAASEPVLQPVNALKGSDKISPILMKEHAGTDGTQATASDAKSPATVSDILSTRSSLVWGRWTSGTVPGDNVTVPFWDALNGNRLLIGDGYYFLFRDPNVPNLLSTASGVVGFSLQSGTATYRAPSNEFSAATVNNGALTIDFNHNTYATTLSLSAPAVGAQSLSSSGTVDPKTGIFASTSNSQTGGAVSLDLRQAGYFFNKAVGNGAIFGSTLWGR